MAAAGTSRLVVPTVGGGARGRWGGVTALVLSLFPGRGAALRDLRLKRRLSLRALGRATRLSAMFLCDLEKNRRTPSQATVDKLARVLYPNKIWKRRKTP